MLPPGCAVPPRALLLHYPTTTPPERILVNLNNLLAELRSERGRINQAISALEGLAGPSAPRRGRPPKSQAAPTLVQRRRTMSLAARKRISAAMKQRWAKWKGKSAPKKVTPTSKKATVRKPMSAAMRKKLSAMMKARWAEKKEPKSVA
jgi:hypothetical protein